MTIFAAAGAKLYIGSVIETDALLTEASFTDEVWVEVKELKGLGTFGSSPAEIDRTVLSSPVMQRMKGLTDNGTFETVCNLDTSDPGQLALYAALQADTDYAFRILFPDAPTGGTGSERLFGATVGAVTETVDEVNNLTLLNGSLWVNSNFVRVAAVEAV
ncbi:hypothetical protein [Pontivivens nitratireducens]|uniref:hypothetical protein n=1 Tax=Pontivivens nitratireducens TaxID=2758038 RepID=UPI0016398907|nr:hypothetical protein [Pontibrevibacter nitratireducens]